MPLILALASMLLFFKLLYTRLDVPHINFLRDKKRLLLIPIAPVVMLDGVKCVLIFFFSDLK
jgi:hypothetical protein